MTAIDGKWIADWRRRYAYTQEALALELGVKRQTIISWEGAPKVDRVIYLALRALELEPILRNVVGKSQKQAKQATAANVGGSECGRIGGVSR